MNSHGPPSSLGSGMALPERHIALALDVAEATWDASAWLVRWLARRCRRHGTAPSSPPAFRAAVEGSRAGLPTARSYAPSTARRYGQIAARFAAWDERHCPDGATAPDFGRFLEAAAEAADRVAATSAGGRRDPRHLALLRTTVCALRATIDRSMGLDLTAAVRLPPRPRPVPAADPGTVAVLRHAARSVRERLLIMLSCDLGLRPGQMAGLRWGDVCLRRGLLLVSGRRGRLEVGIPACCRALLAACGRGRAPGDFLFPSPQGGTGASATVRTLENALRRLAGRAGLAGTTFASLRKACPTSRPSTPRHGTPSERPARPTGNAPKPSADCGDLSACIVTPPQLPPAQDPADGTPTAALVPQANASRAPPPA